MLKEAEVYFRAEARQYPPPFSISGRPQFIKNNRLTKNTPHLSFLRCRLVSLAEGI